MCVDNSVDGVGGNLQKARVFAVSRLDDRIVTTSERIQSKQPVTETDGPLGSPHGEHVTLGLRECS